MKSGGRKLKQDCWIPSLKQKADVGPRAVFRALSLMKLSAVTAAHVCPSQAPLCRAVAVLLGHRELWVLLFRRAASNSYDCRKINQD